MARDTVEVVLSGGLEGSSRALGELVAILIVVVRPALLGVEDWHIGRFTIGQLKYTVLESALTKQYFVTTCLYRSDAKFHKVVNPLKEERGTTREMTTEQNTDGRAWYRTHRGEILITCGAIVVTVLAALFLKYLVLPQFIQDVVALIGFGSLIVMTLYSARAALSKAKRIIDENQS